MVISTLFSFFANIMMTYSCTDRYVNGTMDDEGCSYPQAKSVLDGMRQFNARTVMRNIAILRDFDARSKGGRPATTPDPDLLQELFYQLIH